MGRDANKGYGMMQCDLAKSKNSLVLSETEISIYDFSQIALSL